MEEQIVQVKGFDGYYVSNMGYILSNRPRGNEKNPKLRKLKPKNPGKNNPQKYLGVSFSYGGKSYYGQIHRIVAEHFVDGYFDGAVVGHIDGNNRNNRADNLKWMTQKENIHQSYKDSGMDQTRNYKWWELYDPEGNVLGEFKGHILLEEYIDNNNIPVSKTMLIKWRENKGYKVVAYDKCIESCNDYPQGVRAG